MGRNNVVAGLDIGTTKVGCVVGETGANGELIVTGVGVASSTGLKRGVVVDIESTTQSVSEAVQRAAQQAGRDIESVYVGVTGEHISSLNSRGVAAITHPDREINEDDVERVLQQSRVIVIPPDRVILHAIPRSYSVDGQNGIRHPVGICGTRLEVETHIVTGAQTFLQNVEKCVTRAGLGLDDMVLEPLATSEAVLLPGEKDHGVCLVDIGGGTSDLAIFIEGSIYYSAVIPVGGTHVTSDIAQLLRMTAADAEALKKSAGCALPETVADTETVPITQIGRSDARTLRRKALCQFVEARMQELFALVQKEIMRSGCHGALHAGVVLTGGGSQLAGAAECAANVLQMPVRLGQPSGFAGLGHAVEDPALSTALGLVLYGMEQQNRAAPAERGPLSKLARLWSALLRRLRLE